MSAGLIEAVAPHSLADRIGLRPGDELISINRHRLRDVIDVRFYAAEPHLNLQVRRADEVLKVEAVRRYDESLGLEFAEPTFDGIRRCNNHCEFCFVAQMRPGLRPSLYIKDDDYRHSFLFGSYITLTNLTEADWDRVAAQHLSPLYVSVHATDLELRRRVLRNPNAPDVMGQLRRLADLGIEAHTQIVVQPGVNDGPRLERSIGDLSELYPTVRSVSVVPVGLTRYHRGHCRVHTLKEMRAVFERVTAWQSRLGERLGVNFVYLSDEWYLRLGEPVPLLQDYDGLDLTENGVGLVRGFLEAGDWGSQPLISILHSPFSNLQSPTLVSGELFAPLLQTVTGLEVIPVVNHFFGERVTVAGLLTATDVIAQLQDRELGDVIVLPSAMFGGPEGQSLDEMWPEDVSEALGRPVVRAPVMQPHSARSGSPGPELTPPDCQIRREQGFP